MLSWQSTKRARRSKGGAKTKTREIFKNSDSDEYEGFENQELLRRFRRHLKIPQGSRRPIAPGYGPILTHKSCEAQKKDKISRKGANDAKKYNKNKKTRIIKR
jgi:hypothetical protein